MAANNNNYAFHLIIVTLLASSHLVFLANAISSSGKIHRHLLHEKVEILASSGGDMTKDQMIVNTEENDFIEDEFMSERMDLEKTDYPGPGANKNHTPKPPQRD